MKGKLYRIGILSGRPTTPAAIRLWEGVIEGLRDLGYVEGQNIVIERRYYERGIIEQLPALATELVRLNVDVIVAGASPAPEEAKRVTTTIPIVMTAHPDPVGVGLAASLARPEGNVTGMSALTLDLRGKQLQLLKETLPGVNRVAVLLNPATPTQARELKEAQVAARSIGIAVRAVKSRAPSEFADAFSVATKERSDAMLLILGGALFFEHRTRLADLAARRRLPTISSFREYVDAGGLLAYGPDLGDSYRRAAWYVDRILKGAKPADLPIEQPTKFVLAINVKTAKTLGITIPPSVLARADAVVE